MADSFRLQQAAVVTAIALVVLAAFGPARNQVRKRPKTALAVLVSLDFAYMLWVTTPFVPIGIDESYFTINAHRYRGADLYNSWIRTPLPGLCGALVPWQPLLIGLICKELAAVGAFAVARPALGDPGALWAALLTVVGSRLARYSAFFLGEPYAAAAVTGFVWLAAQRHVLAAAAAGLAFVSRWQMLALAPLVLFSGWQRRRLLGPAVAAALFAVPAAVLIPWTGLDPWRAAQHNQGHATTLIERLLGYCEPKVGFGIGLQGMILAGIGAGLALGREVVARTQLLWCAAAFASCATAALAIGMVMPNYVTAAMPVGCVLMAAGCVNLARRPWLAARPKVTAALAVTLAVVHALPVDPPKTRASRLDSAQALIAADREAFLTALGDAPLHSELEFLAVCAVLARPVHAVIGEHSQHPSGVSLNWGGLWPKVSRAALPAGACVLTRFPEGHQLLWQRDGLALVRW